MHSSLDLASETTRVSGDVFGRFLAVCVNEDIGIDRDHLKDNREEDMEIIFAAGTVIASVVGVGVALGTMIRALRTDLDRIDGLDQRIDGLDRRIDGIERRIDGLEERIDRLDARMRTLESAQNRLSGLLEGLGLTGQLAADRKPAC